MTTPVVNTPSDTGATSKKKTKTNPLACPAAGRGAIHSVVARRRMTTPVVNTPPDTGAIPKEKNKNQPPRLPRRRAGCHPLCGGTAPNDHSRGQHTPRHRSNLQRKNNIVIPEFSAWLTLVLEQCRAENIRNLPRQRAPTPLFPERRPREACSMPISGCHNLPLATFNLPSRNNPQNKRQQRPPQNQKARQCKASPPCGDVFRRGAIVA